MSCRHHAAWIISGGRMLWCPDCGGIRRAEPDESGTGLVFTWSRWIKPQGQERASRALKREEGIDMSDTGYYFDLVDYEDTRIDDDPECCINGHVDDCDALAPAYDIGDLISRSGCRGCCPNGHKPTGLQAEQDEMSERAQRLHDTR